MMYFFKQQILNIPQLLKCVLILKYLFLYKFYYFFYKVIYLSSSSVKYNKNLKLKTIPFNKNYNTYIKLGFQLDSIIKTLFLNIFTKLNSFSVFVLDKFIIFFSVKKTTENLWSFFNNFNFTKKLPVNLFKYFWYILLFFFFLYALI